MDQQEEYRTLEWIMGQSEHGLYLVVAEEEAQEEIAAGCQEKGAGVYDYKLDFGRYSFHALQEKLGFFENASTILIVNFQLAIQTEEDLARLNFSRDMLAGLGKNLIFLTTQCGDNKLAVGAYDFYSFLKLRILFGEPVQEGEKEDAFLSLGTNGTTDEDMLCRNRKDGMGAGSQRNACDKDGKAELGIRRKQVELEEAYISIGKAAVSLENRNFQQAKRLLAYSLKIMEQQFEPGYPELARPYHLMGQVSEKLGEYQQAEAYFKKALEIQETAEPEHPETAQYFHRLSQFYEVQGKYGEAEPFCQKAFSIYKNAMGDGYPGTLAARESLGRLHKKMGMKK